MPSSTGTTVFETALPDQLPAIDSEFAGPPGAGPSLTKTTYVVLHTTTTVPATVMLARATSLTQSSGVADSMNSAPITTALGLTFSTSDSGVSSTGWTWPGAGRPATTTTVADPITATTVGPSAISSTRDAFIHDPISHTVATHSDVMVTPSPSSYAITSWTMWTEVNGVTTPAIVRVESVGTIVPITYAVYDGTLIPLESLSSTRHATPTSTPGATQGKEAAKNREMIAGLVAGTVVGLTLGIILVWLICYKRRRARSRDYLAQGSQSWGGSRESGLLDLNAGTRERDVDREMVIEPWVMPVSVRRMDIESSSVSSRPSSGAGGNIGKSTGRDGSQASVPSSQLGSELVKSRATSQSQLQLSVEQHSPAAISRSKRSVTQAHPQPRAHSQPQSTSRSQPHGATQAPPPNVSPANSAVSEPHLRLEGVLPPQVLRDPGQVENTERHNPIPPLYNEAWRITR